MFTKNRKRIVLAVFVWIVMSVLGAGQEMIKVNNNFIREKAYQIPYYDGLSFEERKNSVESLSLDISYDYYYSHQVIESFYHLNKRQLNISKWVFALFFVFGNCLFNLLILYLLFSLRKLLFQTIYLYGFFFLLAFGIFAIGYVIGMEQNAYAVSRKILGALQSAVPLMLIIPGYWLARQQYL